MACSLDLGTNIGWVTKKVLIAHGFGERFIADFKKKYGETDTRKIGKARQAARFYRVSKINDVVESGDM